MPIGEVSDALAATKRKEQGVHFGRPVFFAHAKLRLHDVIITHDCFGSGAITVEI